MRSGESGKVKVGGEGEGTPAVPSRAARWGTGLCTSPLTPRVLPKGRGPFGRARYREAAESHGSSETLGWLCPRLMPCQHVGEPEHGSVLAVPPACVTAGLPTASPGTPGSLPSRLTVPCTNALATPGHSQPASTFDLPVSPLTVHVR